MIFSYLNIFLHFYFDLLCLFKAENLTEKEKLCLNCKDLYEKGFEEKYNYLSVSCTAAKTAYENAKLSKDLAFIILKGVNRVSYDDVDPYFQLLVSILSIDDSLQQQRFEQVLGYPQLIYNKYDNYGLYEGLEQQYISYESTLPWPDENISILNYVYQNKIKYEVLCTVCLGKLLQFMDKNDNVLNYIAGLPGPSYIYNSYLDWIKPFVTNFIEEAKRLNYPKYSQEKIEKGNELLKFYDSVEKKLASRQKIFQSSKGQIISFTSDYQPLIVGKTVKDSKFSEEILYKKRDDIITLSVIEYKVYAMDSNPNTFTNLSIPTQAIDRNEFQSKEIHPDSTFFMMVNSYFWDESKRRKLIAKKEQNEEENPVDDDEEEVKYTQKVYPESNADENYMRNKPNSSQNKKKSKLTIELPHEKATENAKEEYRESINYDVIESGKKEEKGKNYPLISLPLREINYIRRYVLRNETLENIKVDIKFNENPKNLNVFFPQVISKKIHMKSSQTMITLLKKNCEEEWPDTFNIETSLEFTDLMVIDNNNNNSMGLNNRIVPFASTYPCDDYANVDEFPNAQKKCQICDVYNDPESVKCSFCETLF